MLCLHAIMQSTTASLSELLHIDFEFEGSLTETNIMLDFNVDEFFYGS